MPAGQASLPFIHFNFLFYLCPFRNEMHRNREREKVHMKCKINITIVTSVYLQMGKSSRMGAADPHLSLALF